jgi:hypothetical protein
MPSGRGVSTRRLWLDDSGYVTGIELFVDGGFAHV